MKPFQKDKMPSRRAFIKATATAGTGLSFFPGIVSAYNHIDKERSKKVGIIGLDTSHSIAFTKMLNSPVPNPYFKGYRIVAAYPQGSKDIESSASRIPAYTEEVKKYGVGITGSVVELLDKVDVVLLETNDGRPRLEQALPVLKSGKPMFIDKPVAASFTDVLDIYAAAEFYNVPVFSTSSERYILGMEKIISGEIGRVMGAETFSPVPIEEHHPDLYWYGIHGVETLFTLMGQGCKSVMRIYTEGTDLVVGKWQDGRIGSFRGIRSGQGGYGGRAYGEKAIRELGKFDGYEALLVKIIDFFETGIPPVPPKETIEIYTFMEAAEESKLNGGGWVDMEMILYRGKNSESRLRLN